MKIDFWLSKGQFFLSMYLRIIGTLLSGWILVGCGGKNHLPQSTERVTAVKTTTAYAVEYQTKDFAGMATADDAVNLAFRIAGQILAVDVSKGDFVKLDQMLARLDSRDVELRVAADKSRYERAKSQYERLGRLLEHEAVSQQEYEASLSEYIQAKSTFENTKDLLQDTKLRAPYAGVVERLFVDTYQRVEAGQPILRLVNPVSTTVEFTMPERSLPALSDSLTTFVVTFDNIPDKHFAARLHKFAKTASDASGFPVALKIAAEESRKYGISPGMTCQITMRVADSRSDQVAIPLTAVYAPSEGGEYVWVVGQDMRVERQKVRLGLPFGRDKIGVESGLSEGEEVVTAGVYRLHDGDKVRVIN